MTRPGQKGREPVDPLGDLVDPRLHGSRAHIGIRDGKVKRASGVIDWEYSTLGDPAYDLAIVTRGVRRPFQIDGGLERLLEAYAAAGGANVSVAQVRIHGLCLAAGWYRDALAERAEPTRRG
ncbi:MAG: hypothetical protein DMD83_18255, partial [Candidatus Rokuibacteriota bacterium]